jgi:hypothetical protein
METFYKWEQDGDIYCARVINGHTANYYKNGNVYSLYKQWIPQSTDVEITEEEFYKMIAN